MAAGATLRERPTLAFPNFRHGGVRNCSIQPNSPGRWKPTAAWNPVTCHWRLPGSWSWGDLGSGIPPPLFLDEFEVEQKILGKSISKMKLLQGQFADRGHPVHYSAQPGAQARIAFPWRSMNSWASRVPNSPSNTWNRTDASIALIRPYADPENSRILACGSPEASRIDDETDRPG